MFVKGERLLRRDRLRLRRALDHLVNRAANLFGNAAVFRDAREMLAHLRVEGGRKQVDAGEAHLDVAVALDRVNYWLNLARLHAEREQRERLVRLTQVVAREAVDRLRGEAGLRAGARDFPQRPLVRRLDDAELCVRADE